MTQLSCLPTVTCQRTKPPPATAAADFIGIDDVTTHRWLCKGQTRHPMVPATEWLCSRLASACGLPVPPISVVELETMPGSTYFGSQWQGGSLEFLQAMGRISNPHVFERTHAVDLFVYNTDRHRGNYLYLELAGDIVARVIDFSHSWMVMGWPLPSLPMPACNTVKELPELLAQNTKGYQRPTDIIDRIAALPDDWMCNVMDEMPQEWLAPYLRMALEEWWLEDARTRRAIEAKSSLP